jgi:hypothetical protein
VDRRGRASEVINLIDFQQDRLGHIVPNELKMRISEEVRNIFTPPGKEIIKAKDFVTVAQQSFTQVRTQKTSSASDQDSH